MKRSCPTLPGHKRSRTTNGTHISSSSACVGDVDDQLPPWSSLPTDLLPVILSFCDVLDWLSCGRTNQAFRQASRTVISRAESLNLSYLALLNRGRAQYNHAKQCQDLLVARILEGGVSCKRLELCGLRHVTGLGLCLGDKTPHLTELDLSGCQLLDPHVLGGALEPLSATLLHLDLSGCCRIGPDTVHRIAETLDKLQSLNLQSCSQKIHDRCISAVCLSLKDLRVLNISELSRITDHGAVHLLTLENLEVLKLAGCKRVQLKSFLSRLGEMLYHWVADRGILPVFRAVQTGSVKELRYDEWEGLDPSDQDFLNEFPGWKNLVVLDASCGIRLAGPTSGLLGFIACLSFGALREVNLSGCEGLCDIDVKVLAATCADSLTCLELVACIDIGDDAIKALKGLKWLAYLNISACFLVSDEGVKALCPVYNDFKPEYEAPREENIEMLEERSGCKALRSLKLGNLCRITDKSILAIGGMAKGHDGSILESTNSGLKKLLMLDVRGCRVTGDALCKMLSKCTSLIELDARDTYVLSPSDLTAETAQQHSLRFVNGRRLRTSCSHGGCRCTVSQMSQRLDGRKGVRLEPMMHCIDCELMPFQNRGVCRTCATVCHRGHRTFLGSMTRFYCDCAYSIAGEECRALALPS